MGFTKFKHKGNFNIEAYNSDIELIESIKDSDREINHPRQIIIEQLSEQYDLKLGEIDFHSDEEGTLKFETYGYPYGGTYWINQLIYEHGGLPYLENDDVSTNSLIMKKENEHVIFEKID